MAEKTNETVEEVATEEVEEQVSEVVEQPVEETASEQSVVDAARQNPFKELVYRIAKLFDVKSILTLAFTAAFVYLVKTGEIESEYFVSVYASVVTFYFSKQFTKD